ncbi:hypothetical protein UA08_03528 [Talaromyces atroroseus]|uniref:Gfo/Idh/MocA-like oxidoreductase N-terminal domain-containing protein n=1 Tax=Talaromyces atroroseus TaxID=1441469 RepID=A0A225AV18_TALAT|nr:hypothetical protein UA08_03528 [Talaromyces atroroseus]OKL61148.1 hypothetical protein UA08_03528 [Talaromyces atroroseus]
MAIGVALIGGGIWAIEENLDVAEAAGAQQNPVDLYSEDSSQKWHDILQREDIQAVCISLPIANQLPYIREALAAGKHVLSEKPAAENVADAASLIKWYHANSPANNQATWGVAENFRYLNSFRYARQQIEQLGKIVGFRVRIYADIKEGWKFLNTAWRKNPTHQGGLLLDGGVHYAAGIRYLLGPEVHFTRLSAFTTLLKEHLPPVDTMDAILKTNTGIQGTFQLSVGTTLTGPEWTIGCEKGSVTVSNPAPSALGGKDIPSYTQVTVRPVDGEEIVQIIPNERTGVPPEIRAWGEALAAGRQNAEQIPEEGLADLELIELMLRSGENEGQPQVCQYQDLNPVM